VKSDTLTTLGCFYV